MEQMFEFRRKSYENLSRLIRDYERIREDSEFELTDGMQIVLDARSGSVSRLAAKEFTEFLLDCIDISAFLVYDGNAEKKDAGITVMIDGWGDTVKGFLCETNANGIVIHAHDDRAAQQAFYYLESLMRARRAPFLRFGKTERKPEFYPRLTNSGWGAAVPDLHLRELSYAGMDALVLWGCRGPDNLGGQPFDYNEIVNRAARYGLDVYVGSGIYSAYAPDAPGAEEYYAGTYGELFRQCPGLKGVILVGESIGIPTKDPYASPLDYLSNYTDGIPNEKTSSYYWPCMDYADWLRILSRVIRHHRPDADIVFWTYNFGHAPAEYRTRMIEALPADITLLVTFEVYDLIVSGGNTMMVTDYSLSVPGPADCFCEEAEAAKKRGLRLYTMSNTGGKTWDFGGLPYMPMPGQWQSRYDGLKAAKEKWNLSGIMDSHSYGYSPSFIGALSKETFETQDSGEVIMNRVLSAFFGQDAETVSRALKAWDRAIAVCTPGSEDQYGAFRTGPSYPFNLTLETKIPLMFPTDGLNNGFYSPFYGTNNNGKMTLTALRIKEEIRLLHEMKNDMEEGLAILETIADPEEETRSLINLGRYILNSVITGIHAKEWSRIRKRLLDSEDAEEIPALCDEGEALLIKERENAEATITIVNADSRLGYDPSGMGYTCTEKQLRWKIRQLDYVIKRELNNYRRGCRTPEAMKEKDCSLTVQVV